MNALMEVLGVLFVGWSSTYNWFKERYRSWKDSIRRYWMRGDIWSRALAITIAVGTVGLIGALIYAFCMVAIGLIVLVLFVQILLGLGRTRT